MTTAQPRPTRRQEAGAASRAETRRRLLAAAAAEFAERGYVAATVTRIAARAGVTVQTLYLAWGSKRALLRAHLESALGADADRPYEEVLPIMIAAALDGADEPASVVAAIGSLHRQVAERAGLGWRLYRDAAANDAEVAADWQLLQTLRHGTITTIIRRIPARSLRRGLTRAAAADTAWAIASPDTYDLLVGVRGYTLDQYEAWVTSTLTTSLLRAPAFAP